MTRGTTSHDTFVVERTYDAPVDRVFGAWADPGAKARWFAGSAGALGTTYELDFRVGGHERNRGGPPGGPLYTYDAEYRDIVPGRRIVTTYVMHADGVPISASVATVEFHPVGGSTRMVLTEQGVFLDGHDNVAQREEGTRAFLESLATALASAPPGTR